MNNPFCCLFWQKLFMCYWHVTRERELSWAELSVIFFKFYNEIAIILQSHKLSTFTPPPQLCPNILKNRINRWNTGFPWTLWIPKTKGKTEERWGEAESLKLKWGTRKTVIDFSSPWQGSPLSVHFLPFQMDWISSSQLSWFNII